MRSLHHQAPEMAIAFFTDMHLRFTVARVAATRTQSQVTTDISASAESMRIIHCQHERKRDQCSDAIDLFQAGHLRIMLLGDLLDLTAIFSNPLVESFHFSQQKTHYGSSRRIQPCCQVHSNLFCAAL